MLLSAISFKCHHHIKLQNVPKWIDRFQICKRYEKKKKTIQSSSYEICWCGLFFHHHSKIIIISFHSFTWPKAKPSIIVIVYIYLTESLLIYFELINYTKIFKKYFSHRTLKLWFLLTIFFFHHKLHYNFLTIFYVIIV